MKRQKRQLSHSETSLLNKIVTKTMRLSRVRKMNNVFDDIHLGHGLHVKSPALKKNNHFLCKLKLNQNPQRHST